RKSLEYCIDTWDPDRIGVLVEPQHNTYDIEFWGPNGMTTSLYLAALHAAVEMGTALEEDVAEYQRLMDQGREFVDRELFNGEYYEQRTMWKGLGAGSPVEAHKFSMGPGYSPEAIELLERDGPKYQYGSGCLSDGIIG